MKVSDFIKVLSQYDQNQELVFKFRDQTFGEIYEAEGDLSVQVLLKTNGHYGDDPCYQDGKEMPYSEVECLVVNV